MTRIFTTGAEEADVNALWDKVDCSNGSVFISQTLPFGSIDTLVTPPRTGRGMYNLSNASYLQKDFGTDTSHTDMYFGFAVMFVNLVAEKFFYAYEDSPGVFTNYIGLRLNASGAVEVVRSGTVIATSAVGVIAINTWYYFEVRFLPSNTAGTGRAVVKVNGATVIDHTGDTTNDLERINAYRFSGNDGSLSTYFDDIVVNTPDGAVNNTYPGMVRLLPIRPDAPGTNSDWTRAGVDMGTDEAQLRNGTFEFSMLQTASADALQDAIPEIPDLPAGATITNIVLTAKAKVDAGAGVIAPMVIANGTSDISADQTLITNWRHYQYAWAVNPDDSAAWEEADLSLLKIGVSS